MKRRKKKTLKQRNPVVRTLVQNPKRNAGVHKRKRPTRRDEQRLEE